MCEPKPIRIRGSARWAAFACGRYGLVGSLIGADAETRAVIRSAKNPSPGRGTKCRLRAQTIPTLFGTAVSVSFRVPLRGHPELVGVRIDHPVSAVLRRSEPRHVRAPVRLSHRAGDGDPEQMPGARIRLEDLRRAVEGLVITRNHEVDASVQVVRDLRVDDVHLVTDDECLDELHRRAAGTSRTCGSRPRSRGVTSSIGLWSHGATWSTIRSS